MTHQYRARSSHPGYTSERTAREIFFTMLGAASVCVLLGVAAVGHLAA